MVELEIGSEWDGRALDADQRAKVVLSMHGTVLEMCIESPFAQDTPPHAPPGPTWALWEHEVVELFVLGADEHYTEIEVGPFGNHLVLQLVGRRNIVARELPLALEVERTETRWTARALLDVELLPQRPHRMNAYRIWGGGTARRYGCWAPVPGASPDFHRLECFRPVALI